MSERHAKPSPHGVSMNEWGVPCFGGYSEGDTWHANGNDPFERMLKWMRLSPNLPDGFPNAVIATHDDMDVARSIALSIFGPRWHDHVVEIYDRLVARCSCADRPADDPADDEGAKR